MKCSYTTKKGNITVEFEAPSPKDIFKKIGAVQSMLEEEKCGCCESANIYFSTRQVENGEYYEMRCGDCNAQLSFGQHKNNATLFVKRSDHAQTNGWFVYQGGQGGGGDDGGGHQGGGGGQQSGGGNRQQGNNRQQQPMQPPPPSGGDIPFLWFVPFLIGIASSMLA